MNEQSSDVTGPTNILDEIKDSETSTETQSKEMNGNHEIFDLTSRATKHEEAKQTKNSFKLTENNV